MNELTEKQFKDILFEIYSAGYEAGYSNKIDIKTAFNKYYQELLRNFNQTNLSD